MFQCRQHIYKFTAEQQCMSGEPQETHSDYVYITFSMVEIGKRAIGGKRTRKTRTKQVFTNTIHLIFYFVCFPNIVLVRNCYIIACGSLHGRKEITIYTMLRIVFEKLYKTIFTSILVNNINGFIGRIIVLYYYFVQRICLCENRV